MGTLQVRIDDNIKAEAESLFNSLGLDTSTAVRIFISAALREKGMPFPLSMNSQPGINDLLYAAVQKSNPKRVSLPVDDNGNVIVNKDEHPDIYDWAVNG